MAGVPQPTTVAKMARLVKMARVAKKRLISKECPNCPAGEISRVSHIGQSD